MRSDEAFADIDALVAAAVERECIPGVAYGVIVEGALAHAGGLGVVVAGSSMTPDEHTMFRIASMTKSFTAAAVLLLRDEGHLALDDPIAQHVPELAELRAPTTDGPAITVRHLLTMSAGMATDDAWADRHLDADRDAMDAIFRSGATFAFGPGVAHCYSNLGYAMLGRAVGNVTGRPCQDVIAERLLRPLGMNETSWTEASPSGGAAATGHRLLDGAWATEPALADGGFAPMGGLWSTVSDLATWVRFLSDAFPPRDDADDGPLRRSSRREMQQIARVVPGAPGPTAAASPAVQGYGMGLRVSLDADLGLMVDHSGGLPGFGSNMRWLPGRHVGVVALANVTYANMRTFTRDAFDVLLDHGTPALLVLPVSVPLAEAATRRQARPRRFARVRLLCRLEWGSRLRRCGIRPWLFCDRF